MFRLFFLLLLQVFLFVLFYYFIPTFNLSFSIDFFYSIFFLDDGCVDGDDVSYIIELDDFENSFFYFFVSIFLCMVFSSFVIFLIIFFFEYFNFLFMVLYSSILTKNEFYITFFFFDFFSFIFFFEFLELIFGIGEFFFYKLDDLVSSFDLQGLDYSDHFYDLSVTSFSRISFLVISFESMYLCLDYYLTELLFIDFFYFFLEFLFFW